MGFDYRHIYYLSIYDTHFAPVVWHHKPWRRLYMLQSLGYRWKSVISFRFLIVWNQILAIASFCSFILQLQGQVSWYMKCNSLCHPCVNHCEGGESVWCEFNLSLLLPVHFAPSHQSWSSSQFSPLIGLLVFLTPHLSACLSTLFVSTYFLHSVLLFLYYARRAHTHTIFTQKPDSKQKHDTQ